MNDYAELTTIPEYVAPIWHDGNILNRDEMKWSGKEPPPAIGSRVYVTVNDLGFARVEGYFTESNYLGLLVKFEEPPEWYIENHKRNNGKPPYLGHVFGAEISIPKEKQ